MICLKYKFLFFCFDIFIKFFFKIGVDNGLYKFNVLWEGGYFLFIYVSMLGYLMILRIK